MNPLDVATDGWLDLPSGVAYSGYLSIALPDFIDTESILSIYFKTDYPELVFFKVDEEIRVRFADDVDVSVKTQADLVEKTIEFLSETYSIEIDNITDNEIKFQEKDHIITIPVDKSDIRPLEMLDPKITINN